MDVIDTPFLFRLFSAISERLEENREYLCVLDGEVGDGDHGTSMASGFAAVARLARATETEEMPPAGVLKLAAATFLGEVGATVGPLYAAALLEAARVIQERGTLALNDVDVFLQAIADGIARLGKAQQGDKTMLDVWLPAAHAAHIARGENLSPTLMMRSASDAAMAGLQETAPMIASRGRASRLKERTIGKLDPGAASATLIVEVISEAVAARCDDTKSV